MEHQIIVGNIGTVYDGDSETEAQKNYNEYVDQSKNNYGSAAGEEVTWIEDNEIREEYIPEIIVYSKVTVGYVTQDYVEKDGNFVCVNQTFIAGDQVDREDDYGEPVDIDDSKEIYQDMDMKSPEHGDQINNTWNVDDVRTVALQNDLGLISVSDAKNILQLVLRRFDAECGINWDSIDGCIREYLGEKNGK